MTLSTVAQSWNAEEGRECASASYRPRRTCGLLDARLIIVRGTERVSVAQKIFFSHAVGCRLSAVAVCVCSLSQHVLCPLEAANDTQRSLPGSILWRFSRAKYWDGKVLVLTRRFTIFLTAVVEGPITKTCRCE